MITGNWPVQAEAGAVHFQRLPVDFMADTGVANGLLVIDEIDKESSDRHNGRLSDTLLQLLEPANARTFADPF